MDNLLRIRRSIGKIDGMTNLYDKNYNDKIMLLVEFCEVSAVYLDLGLTTEQLISMHKECLEVAKYYEDINIMVNSRFQLVSLNNNMSRYSESLLILMELIPLVRKYGNDSNHLVTCALLSRTYEYLGLYKDAIACCNMWLAIARKLGDKEYEMQAYLCLAKAYCGLDQCDETIAFCKRCLILAINTDNKICEMKAYECLMFAYLELDQYDDAILHARKCLVIAQKADNKMVEISAYIVLRKASDELNQRDNVILYCKKIINIAKQANHLIYGKEMYFELGVTYQRLQKYEEAILNYKKCSDYAKKTVDNETEREILLRIFNLYYEDLCDYESAIHHGKECIDIAIKNDDKTFQLKAYTLLGMAHGELCQYDDALFYANKGLDIAKQIGLKSFEAIAYGLLGTITCELNLYNEAISYSNKCIDLSRDKYLDISAFLMLGKANKALQKYECAIMYFKKCIEISNEIDDKGTKVLAYRELAETYHSVKQYDDAVLYNKKCIELAKQINELRIEKEAFLNLLRSYQFSNNKNDALHYGKKMLDTASKTDDKRTEMWAHLLLAHTYKTLSNFGALSRHISEGMKITENLKDNKTKEAFGELSFYLYTIVGMQEEAIHFDASTMKELSIVPTCSEIDLLGNLGRARKTNHLHNNIIMLIKLYNFYRSKNQFEQAIKCLEELKELQLGKDWNLFCYIKIAEAYSSMNQYEKAIHYCEDKIPEARQSTDKVQQSNFFTVVGCLYFRRKQFVLAVEYLKKAIHYFELVFTSLGRHDHFKISIFDDFTGCYKLLSLGLLETNEEKEALLVSDRCRARALKDRLTLNFEMKQEVNDERFIQYSDIESIVSSNECCIIFYSEYCDGLMVFSFNGLQFLTSSKFYNQVLQDTINKAFDEMQVNDVVNCENRNLDTDDIQQIPNRAELVHLRCNENLVEQNSSPFCRLDLDSRGNESEISNKRHNCNALKVLYIIMMSHLKTFVTQDEIVIIPDGPINRVPFTALRDPDTGQYLIETKRIRLAPSLTTLKYLIDLPKDLYSKKGALVIGDPSVGKVMLDGVERDMPPLEGAHIEAIVIASRLGVTPLIGKHATKPAVIQRLQQGVSVVHIAAHGSLSKATIMLAPSQETRAANMIPEEKDYMLTMADVQEAKVRAQLVVLSCCHSGRGEIRAEGVVGMCRAFLASGARAVVASLWAIDDDATLDFMSLFYFYLKRGESASTSLQLTMNEIRKCERFKKPKYWAPFFLIGDDVTIVV